MLATVVFLIAIELIDVRGMRRILAVRPVEFVVALITAGAVVVLGVEQGVVIAVVASMIDYLRHSHSPRSSVPAKSAAGHWQSLPLAAGRRTEPGLVIYRFGSSLRLRQHRRLPRRRHRPDRVRRTAELVLPRRCRPSATWTTPRARCCSAHTSNSGHAGPRLVVSNLVVPVRHQLDRYGVTAVVGPDAYFATAGDALEAYQASRRETNDQ